MKWPSFICISIVTLLLSCTQSNPANKGVHYPSTDEEGTLRGQLKQLMNYDHVSHDSTFFELKLLSKEEKYDLYKLVIRPDDSDSIPCYYLKPTTVSPP